MEITTINLGACPLQYLSIGYVGETGARAQVFDFSAWATEYGAGVLQLLLQRPGDAEPYPVVLDIDGTTATWTPDATDTAAQGQGQAQLVYTVGGVVVKNAIFRVLIAPSLGAAGDPPEPYETWLEQLQQLAAETQQSAIDAAGSAEAAGTSADLAAAAKTAAETAQTGAEAAKTGAETAATTAGQSATLARATAAEAAEAARIAGENADYAQQQNIAAGYSAESAHDDAERAAQSAEDAQTASSAAQTAAAAAGASAVDAAAAVTEVETKGAEQITAINQAGATQIAAVDAAGTAQVQAIEDKGEEVLESIPEDYSELSSDVVDLKSAIVSDGSIVNNLHNLVDYKYHAKYFRNPNPSSDNSLKLGIKRFETYIVLNGVLDYTNNNATRVRLNGNVATTLSGSGVETWTTDTVAFVAGHFYRAELKVISGTASTAPAIAIIPAGSSSFISTGSRPDAYTYIAEFTASQNTEYNIVLYCNKNATFTDASMYVIIHDVTAENESIKNNINGERIKSLEDTIEYGTRKKWEQSDFTQGVWQSRAISVSPNSICIDALYPVNAGDVLRIQNNTSGLYFAYGVYVGSAGGASDQSGWITGVSHEHVFAVSGKMFFQCVTAKASADRQPITPADMNFDVGIMDNGFVVETAMLSKQMLPEKNKTIAFLGDSITAGVGTSKIYHMYLGERFGWTCRNYGYGGSGYARSYPSTGGKMATGQVGMGVTITSDNKFEPNDFLTRIATIDTTIDGLVIFGGTNDWAHGDVNSVDAFETAVNNVFTYAQTHFGRIPIIVLLPIHRGNDSTPNATTGKTLKDYCDIIKTIAIPYGIRCIDLFAESGLNPANQHNNDLYYIRDDTSVSDSLHPNHYAHKMISNIIASALYDELY